MAISTSKQTSAAAAVRALDVSWRRYQRRPDHVTTTDFQSDPEDHHRPALRLVYRLTYNDDVAAGQLAVFQGASDEHI